MVVVGFSNDVVAVIPRDDGVRSDVQRTAQSDRVAFSDVAISQFRCELESWATLLCGVDPPALGQRSHRLPSRLRRHRLGR